MSPTSRGSVTFTGSVAWQVKSTRRHVVVLAERRWLLWAIPAGIHLDQPTRLALDPPEAAAELIEQGVGDFPPHHGFDRRVIVPLDTAKNRLSGKLARHADRSRPRGSDERALFLSVRGGRHGTGAPLTARGIQIVLYRLGQKTGIHVHPHKFRHTFATRR